MPRCRHPHRLLSTTATASGLVRVGRSEADVDNACESPLRRADRSSVTSAATRDLWATGTAPDRGEGGATPKRRCHRRWDRLRPRCHVLAGHPRPLTLAAVSTRLGAGRTSSFSHLGPTGAAVSRLVAPRILPGRNRPRPPVSTGGSRCRRGQSASRTPRRHGQPPSRRPDQWRSDFSDATRRLAPTASAGDCWARAGT